MMLLINERYTLLEHISIILLHVYSDLFIGNIVFIYIL